MTHVLRGRISREAIWTDLLPVPRRARVSVRGDGALAARSRNPVPLEVPPEIAPVLHDGGSRLPAYPHISTPPGTSARDDASMIWVALPRGYPNWQPDSPAAAMALAMGVASRRPHATPPVTLHMHHRTFRPHHTLHAFDRRLRQRHVPSSALGRSSGARRSSIRLGLPELGVARDGAWQGTEGAPNPATRPLVKSLMKVLSFLMGRRRKVVPDRLVAVTAVTKTHESDKPPATR